MIFTVIKTTRYGCGKHLGFVEAESSAQAEKKAKRIEQSKKTCLWRGIEWRIKEYNTPFKSNPEQKKLARRAARRCKVDDEYTHRRLNAGGGVNSVPETELSLTTKRLTQSQAALRRD